MQKHIHRFLHTSFLLLGMLCLIPVASFAQLVNNNGAQITINDGAVVIVKTNSVNNGAGNIDNAGNLIIEDDFINNDQATGFGTNTGVYEVVGDWENNAIFIADQCLVRLTGGNQQITGTASTTFYNLSLEGTGVKTQTIDAETSNELTINDLELATDAHKMLVSNPDPNAILWTTGFVSSEGVGQLARSMNQVTSYIFPLGSANGTFRFRPVEIFPNNVGVFEYGARLANVDPTTEGFDRNTKDDEICEINELYYHRIYENGTAGTVDVTIQYDPVADGDFESNAHWQNVPQWENMQNTASAPTAPLASMTTTAWNDFSTEGFALTTLNPVIDSSSMTIYDEYCDLTNGSVQGLVVRNATTGSTFTWTDQSGNVVGTGLQLYQVSDGRYTLTIDKPNGCATTARFDVGDIPAFTIDVTETDILCKGELTGQVSLVMNDGVQPYNFAWSNGASTQDLSGLGPGNYDVTVTDDSSCMVTANATITEPANAFSVDLVGTDILCQGYATGAIDLTTSFGIPQYIYQWSNNATTQNLSGLTAGTYSVTVTDGNNCVATENITLTEPSVSFTATLSATPLLCNGDGTGAVDVGLANGQAPYVFDWSNGASTQNISNLQAGNYSVTIVDDLGCEETENITVSEPPLLVLSTTTENEECEGINGSATVEATGGTQPYAYSWHSATPQTGATYSGLSQGDYPVTVTDDNGCEETITASVVNIPTPVTVFTANPETDVQVLLSNATFSFSNNSQFATTYEWDFGDDNVSTSANPTHTYTDDGEFTVTLTSFNSVGCSTEYDLGPFIVIPDGAIYLPNAFSPNFDGYNDEFMVVGEGIATFDMVIFDRWGHEIKRLTDITQSWNGEGKSGRMLPEGVYTYVIKATLNSGATLERGGTIMLLR